MVGATERVGDLGSGDKSGDKLRAGDATNRLSYF
jgi:hypothetical protein